MMKMEVVEVTIQGGREGGPEGEVSIESRRARGRDRKSDFRSGADVVGSAIMISVHGNYSNQDVRRTACWSVYNTTKWIIIDMLLANYPGWV
jgi:hypothetical protein